MKAPDFFAGMSNQDSISLKSFFGKHLYIQFVDLTLDEAQKEIEILKQMYPKYKSHIEFLTIVDEIKPLSKKELVFFQQIPWKKIIINSNNDILTKYKIKSYPDYIFLDDQGLIYQYPALKPVPNGDLETIEKSFYTVKRRIDTEKANKEKNAMDNIYGDD
jgi:thioredoxin-related protein